MAKSLFSARCSANRTRPILRLSPTVKFSPSEIARSVFECQEQVVSVQTLGDATVCLQIYDSSKTRLGEFLPFDPPDLWKPSI